MLIELVNKIQSYSKDRNVPIISDNTLYYLKQIITTHKPKYCLEIWSAVWYSLINIAWEINNWWGKIIGLEISFPSYKTALSNINLSWLNNINLYNMDFMEFPIDKLIINKLDFVFIDAMKKQYLDYLYLILPYMAKNSVIIMDDVIKFKHRMNQLYLFLDKNQINYSLNQIDEDDGIITIILN